MLTTIKDASVASKEVKNYEPILYLLKYSADDIIVF